MAGARAGTRVGAEILTVGMLSRQQGEAAVPSVSRAPMDEASCWASSVERSCRAIVAVDDLAGSDRTVSWMLCFLCVS